MELYISDYLQMCEPLLESTQPNLMPVTFTLWRRMALKHLKTLEQENQGLVRKDDLLHRFSCLVDQKLLTQFRKLVCQRYKSVIMNE